MSTSRVRADYEQLAEIARTFGSQADGIRSLLQSLSSQKQELEGGQWIGKSADKFYAEMNNAVLPTVRRLVDALARAQQVTGQISRIMKDAENNSAALFRLNGSGGAAGGAAGPAGPASGSAKKSGGGVWGGVKDFFGGMWDEAKDMVGGLYHMVTDPIGTAKGLWHAITHPGELWDAFKKPYVEAWESGHPWRAIGRGVFFAASFALGAKGADKVGKAAKAAEVAEAARAAELAELARMARAGRGVGQADRLGELGGITMRSSNELMGVERASQELLDAVAKKRTVQYALEGSEEMRYLDYIGAEANVGGPNMDHILLRANPSKAAVLEEFLHGTQHRLGIIEKMGHYGLGSAETHVKDFMIRHRRLLGLSDADVEILKVLRDRGL